MVTTPRRISFEDFAKALDSVFDDLAEHEQPILVQRKGRLFRVEPAAMPESEDIWAGYDAERVLAAFEKAREARLFSGIDVESLKADIKAARGQDSKGRPGD
jgi:hypothetical protein